MTDPAMEPLPASGTSTSIDSAKAATRSAPARRKPGRPKGSRNAATPNRRRPALQGVPELEVMRSADAMIAALNTAERGRVVAWLNARHGVELPAVIRRPVGRPPAVRGPGRPAGKTAPAARKTKAPPPAPVAAGTVARLKAAARDKRPGSLTEKFILILSTLGDGATTREVTHAGRDAGIKMANPAYGGFAAAQQGLARRSGKKWSLTPAGRKRVAELGK